MKGFGHKVAHEGGVQAQAVSGLSVDFAEEGDGRGILPAGEGKGGSLRRGLLALEMA